MYHQIFINLNITYFNLMLYLKNVLTKKTTLYTTYLNKKTNCRVYIERY